MSEASSYQANNYAAQRSKFRGSAYPGFAGGATNSERNASISPISNNVNQPVPGGSPTPGQGAPPPSAKISPYSLSQSGALPPASSLRSSTLPDPITDTAVGIGAALLPSGLSSFGSGFGAALGVGEGIGTALSSGADSVFRAATDPLSGAGTSIANAGGTLSGALSSASHIGSSVGYGIGTFASSLIGGAPIEKAALAGVGSAAGSYVGGAIGSAILPGIGTVIGSFIGSFAGSFLGDLFGDGPPPSNFTANSIYSNGQFQLHEDKANDNTRNARNAIVGGTQDLFRQVKEKTGKDPTANNFEFGLGQRDKSYVTLNRADPNTKKWEGPVGDSQWVYNTIRDNINDFYV